MTFHNVCTEGTFDSVIAKICINKIHFEWFFLDLRGLWSPDITPHTTLGNPWIIDSALRHTNMYIPMRHFIQCMGDMALMPIICEKLQILGDFWWFFGPLEPRWDPISFTTRHMNDYFIFGTLNHVCTNEKFDSMYGWYGSNPQNMWKMANFYVMFYDFLDLWSPDGTHILHQTPYEWLFYLWDTQSCMYKWEIWFNLWVIWI